MINPSEAKAQADNRMLPDHYRGCPYFGFHDDPDTRVMFPTSSGTCHQAEPIGQVELSYQQTTCLSAQHKTCPVFLRHHKAPLPPEISGKPVPRRGSRRVLLGVVVIFLFALIGSIVGLWWANSNGEMAALIPANVEDEANVPEATEIVAQAPSETPTAVLQEVEPTAVVVIEPEPTDLLTNTPPPPDTPTPSLPATFTPLAPSATPVPVETAVPSVTAVVDVVRLNVRQGPNTAYDALGLIDEGQTYEIVGRVGDSTWLQLCCVNGQPGWVIAEAVIVEGNLNAVSVVTDFPPLPDNADQ